MARPRHSLSTLRPLDCSQRTQDSVLVAGPALPGGIRTRRIPTKGFRNTGYITSSSPKLLGAGCVPFVRPEMEEGAEGREYDLSRRAMLCKRDRANNRCPNHMRSRFPLL